MKLLGDMHTKIHNRLKTKKSVQSYSARYLPASYSVYIYIYRESVWSTYDSLTSCNYHCPKKRPKRITFQLAGVLQRATVYTSPFGFAKRLQVGRRLLAVSGGLVIASDES